MKNPNNRRGQRFPGTVFGSKKIRDALVEMLNCFYSPTITVKSRSATDGISTITSPAEITIGPTGWKAELDLTNADLSATDSGAIIPFKIYNIAHATDSSLDARTFQIRGGLVGFRSSTVFPGDVFGSISEQKYSGNYEFPLLCGGTDYEFEATAYTSAAPDFSAAPTVNTGGTITLTGAAQLICSNQPGQMPVGGVQIVFPDDVTIASFWMKIVDDPTDGPYVELWGGLGGGALTSNLYFKRGYNLSNAHYNEVTFAVGIVAFGADNLAQISNAQVGHLFNRYLEQMPRPSTDDDLTKFKGFPQIHRGRWTGNSLSGKLFYPGDVVVDDTHNFASAAIGNYYKIYVYDRNYMDVETSPPFANGHFTAYGIYPR